MTGSVMDSGGFASSCFWLNKKDFLPLDFPALTPVPFRGPLSAGEPNTLPVLLSCQSGPLAAWLTKLTAAAYELDRWPILTYCTLNNEVSGNFP